MEEEQGSGWLAPWILAPLVLLLVLFFAGFLLPPTDCSIIHDDSDPGRTAFAIVAGVCSLIAGVAAVARLASMWQQGAYLERDAWLGGLTLLLVAVSAGLALGGDDSALAVCLLAGLALMALSFIALAVAAFLDKDTEDVGALVPVYLFGACLTYPLLAWFALDLNSGTLC
jgi:hypothetical protein